MLRSFALLMLIAWMAPRLAADADSSLQSPPPDTVSPIPSQASDDPIAVSKGGFWHATVQSFFLILGCEIGDRTFFIAAIMTMKHGMPVVFAGAISALAIMTVLSAGLGLILPSLLPVWLTHYACVALFLYFGAKLLYSSYFEEGDGENSELGEVERELDGVTEIAEKEVDDDQDPGAPEACVIGKDDDQLDDVADANGTDEKSSVKVGATQADAKVGESSPEIKRGPFLQALSMTFLAEWGDRSQIATIALAAANDPIGVCVGGVAGHCICTGIAVIGGKILAKAISERMVGFGGGALFLVFGLLGLAWGPPEAAGSSALMR